MTDQTNWELELAQFHWEEGKKIRFSPNSYRTRTVFLCYKGGRQRAQFANGKFPYVSYIELIRSDGSLIFGGIGVVPILPDGRVLMLVEQRPAQGLLESPSLLRIDDQDIDLRQFGQYSSLEFPGGSFENDGTFTAGFLRELVEETGVTPSGTFYRRLHPTCDMGSDLAHEKHIGVIYLKGMSYESYTEADGGLHVFAITKKNVERNIRTGVIRSSQAALMEWMFFREVEEMVASKNLDDQYVSIEEITLGVI